MDIFTCVCIRCVCVWYFNAQPQAQIRIYTSTFSNIYHFIVRVCNIFSSISLSIKNIIIYGWHYVHYSGIFFSLTITQANQLSSLPLTPVSDNCSSTFNFLKTNIFNLTLSEIMWYLCRSALVHLILWFL